MAIRGARGAHHCNGLFQKLGNLRRRGRRTGSPDGVNLGGGGQPPKGKEETWQRNQSLAFTLASFKSGAIQSAVPAILQAASRSSAYTRLSARVGRFPPSSMVIDLPLAKSHVRTAAEKRGPARLALRYGRKLASTAWMLSHAVAHADSRRSANILGP